MSAEAIKHDDNPDLERFLALNAVYIEVQERKNAIEISCAAMTALAAPQPTTL